MKTNYKTPMNTLLTAGLLSLSLMTVFNVYAAGSEHEESMERSEFGHHQGNNFKRMAHHLDLTEQQRSDIKQIKQQAKADTQVLKQSLMSFHQQIATLKSQPMFDEQAFSSTYQQYQETFAQLALNRAKTEHAVYQVLNSEQQKKWDEMLTKRGKKRH